jgi:hypothetical protein
MQASDPRHERARFLRCRRRLLPLCGCALLAIAGCLSPTPPPDSDTLYRHNWWNYYARGTLFLRQNRLEEASADFQRSLGIMRGARFGNDRDSWRARTYGLHFVEGYFPNRELGVCLFEQADYAGAVRYLERSLQQAPSGRAKHYLNLARANQLAGQTVPAPRIRVDGGDADAYTCARTLRLTGVAEGEGYIRRLAVDGHPEFIELATTSRLFVRHIPLAEGTNVIAVTAEDLLGRRVTYHAVRIADWQPPRFHVRRVTAQGGGWLVEGVCRDESGVSAVFLGRETLFSHTGATPPTEVLLAVSVPAVGVALTATDLAGNRLEFPLDARLFAHTEPHGIALAHAWRRADAWALRGAPVVEQMEAAWRDTQQAGRAPVGPTPATSADTEASDRLRPALVLRGCQPLMRVFAEDFFVDGIASDGGGLARVTINGENLLAAGDVGTLRTYFARRLALDIGTNRFEVVATDRSGNRTAQALDVVRILPEHLDERYRLSVGVPPLAPAEAGVTGIRVKRHLEAELTREPVRFRLLERDEGWDYILREQGLSLSDLADPAAALRIGKLLPAELLLMGTIIHEAKGVTVYLRAVETGNGEIVLSDDVYTSRC